MKTILFLFSIVWLVTSVNALPTEVQYLSGTGLFEEKEWRFYVTDGMNSKKWSTIKVPSQWELQGFGEYTYGRWYVEGARNPSMEEGLYELLFNVPRQWRDRNITIVFEGVMTDTEVKVNGKPAGDIHQGGFYRFSYDITDLIQHGRRNKLEVKVSKHSANRSVNAAERRADWWLFGGIYRPVYLEAKPKMHIERIAVDARANGEFHAEVFTTPLPEGFNLKAELMPVKGQQTFSSTNFRLNSSTEKHKISTSWNGVKNWTTETPNLYHLKLTLSDQQGKAVHEFTERIGFRTVEFRVQDGIYINGTKIVMKGINRHSFHPDGGRTTNRDISLEDVILMKEMNMNAVRFHYPPDKHFIDMCDSLGLFVINELAGWQNPYDTQVGRKLVKSTVTRDVNHPSIIMWSNGNEGGWNYELDALFRVYDPQKRHVIHAWADFDDLDTHHYPAYQTGIARLHNGFKVFMPTEIMHGMYDQGHGAGLEDFWKQYTASPLFAGMFMWDFSDNAVKRVDKNGILDSRWFNGTDGIVGPYREKEGSYYTVREVWSPIQIRHTMITPSFTGELFVTNDYLFSSLANCSLRYELKTIGTPITGTGINTIEKGAIALPAIVPGETARIHLPVSEQFFNADVLEIIAIDYNGVEISTWTLPVHLAKQYLAKSGFHTNTPARNAARLAEEEGSLRLSANGVTVQFDKTSGNIVNVQNAKSKISFNEGPIPVGMKTRFNQYKARQEGDIAVATFFYFGGIDSIRWEMHPSGRISMEAVMLTRTTFGGGFDDSFMEENINTFGITFSYPEEHSKGMTWYGRGPFRVWKNRIKGTQYGLWDKAYNNTITGESYENLIYPEFKGFHANLYWATMQTAESDFSVYSESDGVFFRVFTPEEPEHRQNGRNTNPDFPEGDLSFLYEIPAIRDFKPVHQHGPASQPSSIRIKKGDEGVKMKLWFDFNK